MLECQGIGCYTVPRRAWNPSSWWKAAPITLVTERVFFCPRGDKLSGKPFYFCLVNVIQKPLPHHRAVFFLVMKLPVVIPMLNKLPQGCVALQLLVQGHSSAVLPLPSAAVALEAPRLVAASFYTEGGDPRAGQFPAAAKQGCARLFPKV